MLTYDNEKPLEQQKKDIMQNFNFDLVEMVMHIPIIDNGNRSYSPWKLFNSKKLVQPTKEMLVDLADRLLSDVITSYKTKQQNLIWQQCGPFRVVCRYGILELMFVVEYWSCD